MPEKVLFDTDIGSDIDDAVALAYLLMKKECELMGITTVSGEPKKRAMIASAICRAAGRDVPIFSGSEYPILTKIRQPEAGQAKRLVNWDHATEFDGGFIEFMRDTIRSNPGEITLLAVGPMTNVALLFAAYPDVPALLKRLVLMCGAFSPRQVEWNVYCDPYASAVVYNAPVKECVSVGLDVTTRVTLAKDKVREKFTGPVLAPVLDFADVWFEHTEIITFHDPLAAALIFDGKLCARKRGRVEIELGCGRYMGLTSFDEGDGTHEICVDVDADRFFGEYFSTVCPKLSRA